MGRWLNTEDRLPDRQKVYYRHRRMLKPLLQSPSFEGITDIGVRKVVRRHVHAILVQERENRI